MSSFMTVFFYLALFSRFIQVAVDTTTSFLLLNNILLHGLYTHFVYLFIGWWTFELLPSFGHYG